MHSFFSFSQFLHKFLHSICIFLQTRCDCIWGLWFSPMRFFIPNSMRFWDLTTFEKRMYVCMYACMYLPIYLSTYLPIYLSTYLPIYLSIYLSTYLSMSLSLYVSMHLCVYVCMHLCIYVSVYLCICVSMYLCIYVSLCICEAAVLFAKGAAVCSNPTCFAWMLRFVICPVILAHGPCCESYVWCFSLVPGSMSHCSSLIHVETCMAKKWKS